jgi:hypothetical protein
MASVPTSTVGLVEAGYHPQTPSSNSIPSAPSLSGQMPSLSEYAHTRISSVSAGSVLGPPPFHHQHSGSTLSGSAGSMGSGVRPPSTLSASPGDYDRKVPFSILSASDADAPRPMSTVTTSTDTDRPMHERSPSLGSQDHATISMVVVGQPTGQQFPPIPFSPPPAMQPASSGPNSPGVSAPPPGAARPLVVDQGPGPDADEPPAYTAEPSST